MTITNIEYDETRGGPRHPDNRISIPKGGDFYKATKNVIPWAEVGARDPGRVTAPSIYVEKLLRLAHVTNPQALSDHTFMTRTVDMDGWGKEALDLLVEEGLLIEEGDDGDGDALVEYEHADDLQLRADELVRQLQDDPKLEVTPKSFEWLEGFNDRHQDAGVKWLEAITLEALTTKCRTLEAYIDLNLIVGPHATEDSRVDPEALFFSVTDGGTKKGGQLGQAVATFYYQMGADSGGLGGLSPAFLAPRVTDFLLESRWPHPYDQALPSWAEYTFDLPRRVVLKTATRQQWASMVRGRLARAISHYLPTLHTIFEDYYGDPDKLVRAVQTLGDAVLPGDDGLKLPFYKILEVEAHLEKYYSSTISSEREAGGDTDTILEKLDDRLAAAKNVSKGVAAVGDPDGEDLRGPKPGQMSRALAEASFSQLEAKHLENLRNGGTNDERLKVIADNFQADTVLPKAVLMACKGARISVYVGQGGSDYLAILFDERHLLSMYLGQSLAYDADMQQVPDDLKTFVYDAEETEHTRNFEWHKLDPLNKCILKLRGEEAGTHFAKYLVHNLYHSGDMIQAVRDYYGKKFDALGYPRDVPEGKGLSFRGFMTRILRIQTFAVALGADAQKGAHGVIDDYVRRGFVAAADAAKRTIYSASPADKKLGPWLAAEEGVVIELGATLEAIKEASLWSRRTHGIFGAKAQAAHLPGFVMAIGGKDTSTGAPPGTHGGAGGSGNGQGKSKNQTSSR